MPPPTRFTLSPCHLVTLSLVALASAQTAPSPPAAPITAPAIPPAQPIRGKLGTPIQIFNGKDLAGWSWHCASNPNSKIEDVWSVKDGLLHCGPRPLGYIRTDPIYKNFILTVEYRHLTPANGGTFICIHGTDKVWPDSIQVQGNFGKVGDLINQNSAMTHMTTDPARTKTVNRDVVISRLGGRDDENPIKEWNTLIITMEDGNLAITLNGKLVNTAADITPNSGQVGLQAEGAEMDFRKVELTPIE